jgi:DNA-binding protein YbaB
MIDTDVRRRGASHRALTELVAVEETRDGLATVTVGVLGDLRDLRFDPRVARCRDAGALAETVMRTVRAAAAAVHRSSAGLVAQLVPDHPLGAEVDLLFDPMLYQLDRRIAATGESDAGFDYRGLRQRVLAMRDLAEDLRETMTSPDGQITATVSGRRALVDLTLGRRATSTRHADQLADDILATVRRATARVGEQLTGTWTGTWTAS